MARTLVESRGGTSRTASEVARANVGQVELGHSGSVLGLFDAKRKGGPPRGRLVPNPRQGGVPLGQRRPRLKQCQRAPGRAELGRAGIILGLFDSRLPLKLTERGPARLGPAPNPRQGGFSPRQRQFRVI